MSGQEPDNQNIRLYIFNDISSEKTNKEDPNSIEKDLKTCLSFRKETIKKKQDNKEQNKDKQVNEVQVEKEQNKDKQVKKEQNKDNQVNEEQDKEVQDKEEQDKDDNVLEIRKQRSRYYLWKLYKEYEQMRLNRKYRMINFIHDNVVVLNILFDDD
ncbi:3714_t:CDS:2 [Gigaspora rosea]|nr:3714_t:CDS:2 [Gigaspora rosea]